MFLVTMPKTETSAEGTFTITKKFFSVVRKYVALRPPNTVQNRFFVNYRNDKCYAQPIGKNKLAKMPQRIANYLNLPEPKRYTGIHNAININENCDELLF